MSNTLKELIQALLPHVQTQAELDEAFLAKSADMPDLEHRMRELDLHGHEGALAGGRLPNHWSRD
jgi:hypothetical protein